MAATNGPAGSPVGSPVDRDDLSALSWVQEELRRSLETANKSLRRYVKEQAQRSDMDTVDPAVLRQARSQLHQSVGVLELVGLGPPAEVLRAAEAALQRLSSRPKLFTAAAVDTIERGSFAVLDFIDRRLVDKPVSTLALFPQYRALQELAGISRSHPSDLWTVPWSWRDLVPDASVPPMPPDDSAVSRIEADLLALMRGAPPSVAARMSELFASLAAGVLQSGSTDADGLPLPLTGQHKRLATLWQLASGFFEAQADGLLAADAYSKRIGSKLLAQLRAGGQAEPSERLAHDLLFFCGQAAPRDGVALGPRLAAVRRGYDLAATPAADYEQLRLGRFDPAWIAQARKRVAAAKEVWSAVAGGDLARLTGLSEQFVLVSDSLARLYPDGGVLGRALQVAAAHTSATGSEPPAELAMEVATALLYIDASLDDGDFDHPDGAQRIHRLAQRVDAVRQARDPGVLELWMEELYRRVSDRQTMGSVVQELRASLSEIEKHIDQYFRNPAQREVLIPVPAQLSAMRGVLSVLGLDQATQAVLRMRDDVDTLANTEVNPQHVINAGTFDRLADNLGALSFLIDMVSVQPQMAKSLFRFDPETGSLSAVMAREDRPTGFDELDTRPGDAARAQPDTDALAVTLDFDRIVKQSRATQRGAGQLSAAASGSAVPRDSGATSRPPALGSQGLPMLDLAAWAEPDPASVPGLPSGAAHADRAALGAGDPAATAAVPPAPSPSAWVSGLEDDPEMREVFLDEAVEVLQGARAALSELQSRHDDPLALGNLRRAFHTLKGSARMVGLGVFGDAAWACEQLFNARLAEPGGAADTDLREFSLEVCSYFEQWVKAIADGDAGHCGSGAVVRSADALRTERRRIALVGVAAAPLDATDAAAAPVEAVTVDRAAFEFDADDLPLDASGAVPGQWLPPSMASTPAPTPAQGGLRARIPDLPLASDLDLLPLPQPLPQPAAVAEALATPSKPAAAPTVEPASEPALLELDMAALDEEPKPDPAAALARVASGHGAQPDTAAQTEPERRPAAALIAVAEATEIDVDIDFLIESTEPVGMQAGALALVLNGDEAVAVAPVLIPAPDTPFEALDLLLDGGMDDAARSADSPGDLLAADLTAPATSPLPEVADGAVVAHVADVAGATAALAGAALASEVQASAVQTPATLPTLDDEPASDADAYRQIGPLRIGIPLFNIYLNEADELSRRLGVELAEWALEQHRPVGDAAVALAHSLAGNSGTVGYVELSQLARELEHALERADARGHSRGQEAQLFNRVADEIRRLLHLFAAGFLHSPDAGLLEALRELTHGAPEAAPADSPPAAGQDLAGAAFGRVALLPFEALGSPQAASSAVAHARDGGTGFDDDIDQVDALDEELLPFFVEEAQELLPQLQSRLRDWAQRPGDPAAPSACMRSLHTLKGSARLAGAMRLGELAHRLESAVERLSAEGAAATAESVATLVSFADTLEAGLEALRLPAAAAPGAAAVAAGTAISVALQRLVVAPPALAATAATDVPAATAGGKVPAAPTPTPTAPVAVAVAGRTAMPTANIDWARFAGPAEATEAAVMATAGVAAAGTVRVRAPLLDRLVNQAGEVSITRARIESDVGQLRGGLADLSDNLERLRAQLRDIELQAETQIGTRMEAARAAAQQFDPLEMDRFTRFQELTRMMAESVSDVATVQRSLQRTLQSTEDALAHQARMTRGMTDDLLRTRMVEFEGLSERLYRVVRLAAKETGKSVRLDIEGGGVEIDRGVLDRMTPAFEHLLRNSVVHGIEAPAQRSAAGKDVTGTITVRVSQVGNEVGVEVRDDGAGLDLPRILAQARTLSLVAIDASPDDAALANLIFQPGFSTADRITDLAGRGVGMDVVRTDINAMGGRIETASSPGQGTSFRLVLPLTTAVTQVVMLRCGNRAVAVPSTLVEIVRRVPVADLASAYEQGVYTEGTTALPFFWLDALLMGTPRGVATGRTAPVVVIRSAAQRVVLHVDEVLGNQEVVVKNLGPQLSRVPGLVGLTLLASGLPALIYNPVAVATLYGDAAREATVQALRLAGPQGLLSGVAQAVPKAPLVLVVDDSLTVRRITQRLLEREGYRVVVAKDGLEGLEKLGSERPAVLLTDIEMPRMDGFDLVRNMRADAQLANLPVIMITSRLAQKHRDYAAELGVDHYLGKPYAEDDLLGLVARYARRAVSA